MSDNFPSGCPCNKKDEDILKEIESKNIDMIIVPSGNQSTNEEVKKMITHFAGFSKRIVEEKLSREIFDYPLLRRLK